jgi:hypothetical protein
MAMVCKLSDRIVLKDVGLVVWGRSGETKFSKYIRNYRKKKNQRRSLTQVTMNTEPNSRGDDLRYP